MKRKKKPKRNNENSKQQHTVAMEWHAIDIKVFSINYVYFYRSEFRTKSCHLWLLFLKYKSECIFLKLTIRLVADFCDHLEHLFENYLENLHQKYKTKLKLQAIIIIQSVKVISSSSHDLVTHFDWRKLEKHRNN